MIRVKSIVPAGIAVVMSTLVPSASSALDLFKDTLPQAQSNTCQSYAIMLALAAKGDAAFPINTFAELRKAESDFRDIAEGLEGGPYGHEALRQAVSRYTGGQYSLEIETVTNGIVGLISRIRDLTTIQSSADVLIAQLTGTSFPVVLTSVTKFDDSNYRTGHIIAVLGVSGSGINSNTHIVAFNSALKGGGNINRCEPGTQPGDMSYTAGVVSTNNYVLKDYPGFRLMQLRKN
jgi:hypothetical protein